MSDIKVLSTQTQTQSQSIASTQSSEVKSSSVPSLSSLSSLVPVVVPFTGSLPKSTKQVVLLSVPIGIPTQSNFSYREVPLRDLVDGEFLVRIHYLSVDPYVRAFAMGPNDIGKVVTGYGVGDIIASKSINWPVGAFVTGN